jgi:hypothetical protein
MAQAAEVSSFTEVKHHKNNSNLHKRTPSREEDELLLSRMPSSLHAAKLRTHVQEEKLHTYHTPVEFSWKQFWVTFIYESLPPLRCC